MKILKFILTPDHQTQCLQIKDVQRIVDVCESRGYFISNSDARLAWEEFSYSVAASWITLEDDNQILQNIMEFCEVINNEST